MHRRMLEVNAVGTMNGTLAAIEKMRPGAPRSHHQPDLAGRARGRPGIVGYSASKHAAIAFSLGTAADLRRAGLSGIHISCVCPDGVWTPMINDKLDDPNDALSFSGVMLMPEQVAGAGRGIARQTQAGPHHPELARAASSASSTGTRR